MFTGMHTNLNSGMLPKSNAVHVYKASFLSEINEKTLNVTITN